MDLSLLNPLLVDDREATKSSHQFIASTSHDRLGGKRSQLTINNIEGISTIDAVGRGPPPLRPAGLLDIVSIPTTSGSETFNSVAHLVDGGYIDA